MLCLCSSPIVTCNKVTRGMVGVYCIAESAVLHGYLDHDVMGDLIS